MSSRFIWPRTVGTICQETPYRSLNQPHCSIAGSDESVFHIASISCCVSQFAMSEIAGEKVKAGPPFKAMNSKHRKHKARYRPRTRP